MVYVFLADGFEETEAVAPIDMLRRAGVDVTTVGLKKRFAIGSHGMMIGTDIADDEVVLGEQVEMVILPGGMPGTLNLEKNPTVMKAIAHCAEAGKYIGAICAAPSILGHVGLLRGKRAVCFPGFEGELDGAIPGGESVCQDGKMITARGAGVAVEFGLKLVEALKGEKAARKIRESIQCG